MKAFSLSAIFLFLISCKSEIYDNIPIIEIEGNIKNFKTFRLSDLNCELEYVVLQTTPDAMLNEFFLVEPSNIDEQIEPTGLKNDIDGGINFMPRYAVNDTLIVSWFEAFELKMYVASEAFKYSTPKYPGKKKELEELAASLDENDNPVLMLVKLKN